MGAHPQPGQNKLSKLTETCLQYSGFTHPRGGNHEVQLSFKGKRQTPRSCCRSGGEVLEEHMGPEIFLRPQIYKRPQITAGRRKTNASYGLIPSWQKMERKETSAPCWMCLSLIFKSCSSRAGGGVTERGMELKGSLLLLPVRLSARLCKRSLAPHRE